MIPDTNRFFEILKPHFTDASRYCKALCAKQTREEAEDVFQQSLLLALENFSSLKDTSKFRSWFFSIITRSFYTSVRRHFWKRFLSLETINSGFPVIFSKETFNEDSETLMMALGKLSEKERSAVLLFEIANFSIEEISVIQNERSQSAVKSRLSRARRKLRDYITRMDKNGISENKSSKILTGDIENETLKIITEIDRE